MNNFSRFCLRCGAWDSIKNECNKRQCTINSALLNDNKIQGYQCKLLRYEYNIKQRSV